MGDPLGVTDYSIPETNLLVNNTFCCFPDMDASPTKAFLVENSQISKYKKFYTYAFEKRPARELFSIKDDPDPGPQSCG